MSRKRTRKRAGGVVDVWDAVAKVPAGDGVQSLAELEAERLGVVAEQERARVEQERRDRRNAQRRYRRATRKADSTAPPQAERDPVEVAALVPALPVDPRIARAAARDAAWAADQRVSSSPTPGLEGLAEWLNTPRRRRRSE